MSAYCIFDIREVTDPGKMSEYRQLVGPTVEAFNGRFLVTGGEFSVMEGDWQPVFPVIIEFPSLQAAHDWYDSEAYRGPRALRLEASRGNAVFIEGL
ncbi:MAG: DUF1330 domain-containing protein [Gammaproteobacteria bacterium]